MEWSKCLRGDLSVTPFGCPPTALLFGTTNDWTDVRMSDILLDEVEMVVISLSASASALEKNTWRRDDGLLFFTST